MYMPDVNYLPGGMLCVPPGGIKGQFGGAGIYCDGLSKVVGRGQISA
jgi:hypothetical protein